MVNLIAHSSMAYLVVDDDLYGWPRRNGGGGGHDTSLNL
jgi:hypothetical protein